jgi:hypothetical protein
MFNRKRLALALVAAAPLSAFAGAFTTDVTAAAASPFTNALTANGNSYNREFLTTDSVITYNDQALGYSMANALTAGDRITFTFSDAPLDLVSATTTRAFPFPSSITATNGADPTAAAGGGVLNLVSQTATSVTYAAATNITATADFVIASGGLTFATKTAGDVTVSASSATSAGATLSEGTTTPYVLVDDAGVDLSIAFDTATLAELIDVSATVPKTAFTVAPARTASFEIDVVDSTSNGDTRVLADADTQLTVTITGADFSWLDDDLTNAVIAGDIDVNIGSGALTAGAEINFRDSAGANLAGSVVAAATNFETGTLTVLLTGGTFINDDATDTITVTFVSPATNTREIPEQDISVTATLAATDDSASVALAAPVTLATASATASYSLNGSNVVVYAVPVANSVQNFIYLSNSSSISGSVFVSVVDDGTTYGPFDLGTSDPDTEFDIGARFIGAVNESGATLSGNRVRLEISAELPANATTVSASYRSITANDRVNLLTDQETQ